MGQIPTSDAPPHHHMIPSLPASTRTTNLRQAILHQIFGVRLHRSWVQPNNSRSIIEMTRTKVPWSCPSSAVRSRRRKITHSPPTAFALKMTHSNDMKNATTKSSTSEANPPLIQSKERCPNPHRIHLRLMMITTITNMLRQRADITPYASRENITMHGIRVISSAFQLNPTI